MSKKEILATVIGIVIMFLFGYFSYDFISNLHHYHQTLSTVVYYIGLVNAIIAGFISFSIFFTLFMQVIFIIEDWLNE